MNDRRKRIKLNRHERENAGKFLTKARKEEEGMRKGGKGMKMEGVKEGRREDGKEGRKGRRTSRM